MPWWGWVVLGVVFVGAVAVAQWRGWIELRGTAGRHGSGIGAFGALDEVFHPTRHEAEQDLARRTSMPAPAPVPGNGPLDLDAGRVRIDVRPPAG